MSVAGWIEVARAPELADAHPEWMASLGMHDDWRQRFPKLPAPREGQVAKAYPWVPIAYTAAFDAQLRRVREILSGLPPRMSRIYLNDLQGGPASCGCGNLQCRWAIDYGVESTTEKGSVDDAAPRFLQSLSTAFPQRQFIPVWTTECEDVDLPADRRAGQPTTGLCGTVACSLGTCPKAFATQWKALHATHKGPVAVLATHREFQRVPPIAAPELAIDQAIKYLDSMPTRDGAEKLSRERLWIVVQGYDDEQDVARSVQQAAMAHAPAGVIVARVPVRADYEPRWIDFPKKADSE